MTPLIIFAILSALCTLYLAFPIAMTHKRSCYALMLIIPLFSLVIYMLTGSPALSSKPASTQHISSIKEEQHLLEMLNHDKSNIELTSQLAGIYIANDKLDKAIELLSRALIDDADNKDLQLQRATAYFAKGLRHAERNQKKQALKLLRKAYETSPKDAPFLPDIMHFIDKVKSMDENLRNDLKN